MSCGSSCEARSKPTGCGSPVTPGPNSFRPLASARRRRPSPISWCTRLPSGWRLAAVPVFSSDGLALYFYALTAHFGAWVQLAETRGHLGRRPEPAVCTGDTAPAAGAGVEKYRRKRIMEVHHRVQVGTPETYQQVLRAAGLTRQIQTAFIERLNLTIRRSIASLARRTWSAGHSLGDLALQFQWWRAYYHFARPHASLRLPLILNPSAPGRASHQRLRLCTPAQAAGLSDHHWSVLEVLACPVPPLDAG